MAGILGLGLLASCAAHSNEVGSYVMSDDDGVVMVQITSIEKGLVNGTIAMVTANQDGGNDAAARPFSGTIEGGAVNLTIGTGLGSALATGKFDGDQLRLTLYANGKSSQITLAKSDAGKFDELANATRVRASEKKQQIQSAAVATKREVQRSTFQETIDRQAHSILEKATELGGKIQKFEAVMASYRDARQRATAMKTAKHKLSASLGNGSFQAGQIDFKLDSLANSVERTHSDVSNYMTSLTSFVDDAAIQSRKMLAECDIDHSLNCSRLLTNNEVLQGRYELFRHSFKQEKEAFGRGLVD